MPLLVHERQFPKITVDTEKCTVPFLCKLCLKICPEAVFQVRLPAEKQMSLKENDPRIDGLYVLGVLRRDKCYACMRCVEVCPVDALTVEAPKVEPYKYQRKDLEYLGR